MILRSIVLNILDDLAERNGEKSLGFQMTHRLLDSKAQNKATNKKVKTFNKVVF